MFRFYFNKEEIKWELYINILAIISRSLFGKNSNGKKKKKKMLILKKNSNPYGRSLLLRSQKIPE